jgi:hypothetical protein
MKGMVRGAMGIEEESLDVNVGESVGENVAENEGDNKKNHGEGPGAPAEPAEDLEDGLDEPPEAVDPVRRRVEPLPSPEEQRLHRITHLPFRSWCPYCVAAAANDHPHRRVVRPEEVRLAVPEVHWDYCFPRDDKDWNVVLVGRDKETKMTVAHVVPYKGQRLTGSENNSSEI